MSASFQFPKPDDLINLNDRKGRWSRAAQTKAWRTATFYAISSEIHAGRFQRPQPPSVVQVVLPVGSLNQRRDPHNFIPTVKAIVDGMVDAKVWPDDNSDWVTVVDPRFQRGGLVTVFITPRGSQ